MGIPPEEKDKGPNKGDTLDGAVSWTRDLVWALHGATKTYHNVICGKDFSWLYQACKDAGIISSRRDDSPAPLLHRIPFVLKEDYSRHRQTTSTTVFGIHL